jgi:two-component system NarL family sensor kinase
VLTALSLLLLALNRSEPNVHLYDYWAEYTLGALTFSTVGAFVASRRPENSIGWIFCAIGLYSGVGHFAAQYATYTILTRPDSLPGGPALAWIYNWGYVVGIGLLVYLLLLFPDGRLVSRRWRWFAWLSVAVFTVATIWAALQPGPMSGLGPIRNPLGIEVATGTLEDVLDSVTGSLMAVVGLGAAVSLFVRLRHAEGVVHLVSSRQKEHPKARSGGCDATLPPARRTCGSSLLGGVHRPP